MTRLTSSFGFDPPDDYVKPNYSPLDRLGLKVDKQMQLMKNHAHNQLCDAENLADLMCLLHVVVLQHETEIAQLRGRLTTVEYTLEAKNQ